MMRQENDLIHPKMKEDYAAVENLVRESFWNAYRPGCSEPYVIGVLPRAPAFYRSFEPRGILFYKTGRLSYNNGSNAVIPFLRFHRPRRAETVPETERLYG